MPTNANSYPVEPGFYWANVTDYGEITKRNFLNAIVEVHGQPGFLRCTAFVHHGDIAGPGCIPDVPVYKIIFGPKIEGPDDALRSAVKAVDRRLAPL
jgi:hypothetical protein